MRALQLEKGFLANPLTVNWLNGCPPGVSSSRDNMQSKTSSTGISGIKAFPSMSSDNTAPTKYKTFPCFPPPADNFSQVRLISDIEL